MALTIPKITKGNFELLNENMELMNDHLSDQQKAQIAEFKFQKEKEAKEKQLRKLLFKANHPGLAKAQELVSKGFAKLMKMRWFDKITGFFKQMASNAMGWFDLIVGIIILFKTGIIQEAIPLILNIATSILTMFIKMVPTILKFVWQIVTRTIPQLLKQLFNTVFDAIGLPNDHPIRKFFNFIFDNFPKFADFLLKTFKDIFIAIFQFVDKAWKFMQPFFEMLAKVLPEVGKIIWDFLKNEYFVGLKEVWAIIGNGIKSLLDSFTGSEVFMAILGKSLKIFWEITKFVFMLPINIIKFIKMTFEFITKTLPTWFGNFVGSVKNFIFKTIPSLFKKAADFILRPIKNIFEGISKFFEPLSKFFNSFKDIKDDLAGGAGNLLENIRGGAKKLLDNPKQFILDLFTGLVNGVKALPQKIMDTLKGVFNWVIAFFGLLGEMVINIRQAPEMIKNFDKLMKTRTEEMATADALKKANERAGNTTTSSDSSRQSVMFGKKFAKGGRVQSGEPIIVGDEGTELFTPTDHGNVTSNNEFKEMIALLRDIRNSLKSTGTPQPTFTELVRAR